MMREDAREQYAFTCYILQTRVGLSRSDVVGEEVVVYSFENGQLRPTMGRKLGMPVTAFMTYLKMMEKENKLMKRANQAPAMGGGQRTFRKR